MQCWEGHTGFAAWDSTGLILLLSFSYDKIFFLFCYLLLLCLRMHMCVCAYPGESTHVWVREQFVVGSYPLIVYSRERNQLAGMCSEVF